MLLRTKQGTWDLPAAGADAGPEAEARPPAWRVARARVVRGHLTLRDLTAEPPREIVLDELTASLEALGKAGLSPLEVTARLEPHPRSQLSFKGRLGSLASAADAGLLDRESTMLEMLTAIKRAGADIIITYFAKEAAKLLSGN